MEKYLSRLRKINKTKRDAEKQELLSTQKVIIKGIDIPFFDLVSLLVKIFFASIPAAIIVTILWAIIVKFFLGL